MKDHILDEPMIATQSGLFVAGYFDPKEAPAPSPMQAPAPAPAAVQQPLPTTRFPFLSFLPQVTYVGY